MALTAVRTAVLEFVFKDRESEAQWSCRFPFSFEANDALPLIQLYADASQAISNALFVRATIRYEYREIVYAEAPLSSKVTRKLALYYSNGEEYEAIYIPSGREDLLEATGPYAGVRLDATNAEVITALGLLNTALTVAITPEGEPFPTEFIVGGIAV